MSENVTDGERVLPVAVFSDYTCPWCYVGTARLDRLREELAGEVVLQVEWMPFEIHPEVPPEGLPLSALGFPPAQLEMMTAHLRRQAEAEGLPMAHHSRLANTHAALVASAYAQAEEPERFEAFHHALFRAYFGEGRNLADPAVLREVAGESGIDVERMDAALAEGRYEAALRETTDTARRLGITGTPTFVFGRRYAAVGAQSVEELRRVAERALEG